MAINYFWEDVSEFKISKRMLNSWIKTCISSYKLKTGDINYIFCSDQYLKEINKEYLKHDYFTDIITFNYNEDKLVLGDIYISSERVADNAIEYNVNFDIELLRVIIHGVLHLCGINDSTDLEKEVIHKLEDYWINIYKTS